MDYNQNAWGRTLASVYSVRPKEFAGVSTPVSWEEVERGFHIDDFRLENVPARVRKLGDLWKPLLSSRGRFRLEEVLLRSRDGFLRWRPNRPSPVTLEQIKR